MALRPAMTLMRLGYIPTELRTTRHNVIPPPKSFAKATCFKGKLIKKTSSDLKGKKYENKIGRNIMILVDMFNILLGSEKSLGNVVRNTETANRCHQNNLINTYNLVL